MLLAILFLGLSSRSTLGVHPLWTIRVRGPIDPVHCRIDGEHFVAGSECFSFASGKHIDGRPSKRPVDEILQHFIEPTRDPVLQIGKTGLHVIKDTGRTVIGYDEGYHRLFEAERDSSDHSQSIQIPLDLPGETRWVSGDLSAGYLVVAGMKPDLNFAVMRLILLSPIRLSPLRYFRYYDARLVSRCLGVMQHKGETVNDYTLQRKTPDAPLACGNGNTGQVYWRSVGFKFGRWITPRWVLAHSDDSSHWAVLDGRSGRVVIKDIAKLGPLSYEDGVISDLKGHFIFLLPDLDSKFTTISAFELSEKWAECRN